MRPPRQLVVLTLSAVALASPATSLSLAQEPVPRRALAIGCDDCEDPRQFGSIQDVSVGPSGEILVLDATPPKLRLFDRTGRLLWAGGRDGSGPGEYRLPIRARLLSDGSVVVLDMTLRRATVLDAERRVRETVPLDRFFGTSDIAPDGRVTLGTDDLLGRLEVAEWRPGGVVRGRSVLRFGDPAPGRTMIFPAIARAPDGTLAAVLTSEYAIVRLDTALRITGTIERDIERRPRTPAEREELRQRLATRGVTLRATEGAAGGSSATGGSPASLLDEPKPHLAIDPLRFDEAGRLWVLTQRGTESRTVLDLYDAHGALIGEVVVPGRLTAWSVGGGRLVGATTDAGGSPVVVAWDVR